MLHFIENLSEKHKRKALLFLPMAMFCLITCHNRELRHLDNYNMRWKRKSSNFFIFVQLFSVGSWVKLLSQWLEKRGSHSWKDEQKMAEKRGNWVSL